MSPLDRRGFVAATGAAAAALALNPLSAAAIGQSDGSNPTGGGSATATGGLPYDDRADFADAERGFVAALTPGVVKNAAGQVIWDNDAYAFLNGNGKAPKTANAGLWRQSQLTAKQGLFKVTERIYQVRGLDLSNMTIVEGDTGILVIDR